ncbi:PREDICTED: alpha-crystallin A chain-like [Cyprinodon variegatus]|uniref:Alpha-crystallin A chain-like n=1 Tax=Cyprinodon variegatus TaxID=28743 RepID=A0A3Q2DK58_CYPVA|nr:PREDICTED: alpha-crystallin A chain-like [Cyprinodon variegatus]
MVSHHSALSSLFADEPFLSQEGMLWPLCDEALSSLQQNFFGRRGKLAESLLRDVHDGSQLLTLAQFPVISSTLKRLNKDREKRTEVVTTDLNKNTEQTSDKNDLLVTLDARGYAPGDITVKLEGRSLAVVAMKQAGAEESQSCSSSSSSASFSSSASSQMGFMQRIDFPDHLDLSGLSCSLMDDGQLRIHAPVAKQPIGEEKQVPIRYRTSLEFPIKNGNTDEEHRD